MLIIKFTDYNLNSVHTDKSYHYYFMIGLNPK